MAPCNKKAFMAGGDSNERIGLFQSIVNAATAAAEKARTRNLEKRTRKQLERAAHDHNALITNDVIQKITKKFQDRNKTE